MEGARNFPLIPGLIVRFVRVETLHFELGDDLGVLLSAQLHVVCLLTMSEVSPIYDRFYKHGRWFGEYLRAGRAAEFIHTQTTDPCSCPTSPQHTKRAH